jgi:YebC/PmpR family DNA-binding regulatory protein
MSGHSKWNNIKNRKSAQDQKKSKDFFDVTKMIRIAVKMSHDGNPDTNPSLRLALEKARSVNMPKENVQRAIDRALGQGEYGQNIQEVIYEGYGPGGVGFLVVAGTDNTQRTSATVKFAFSRAGGSLGGPGSVMFMFSRDGAEFVPTIPMPISAEQMEQVEALKDTLVEDDDVEEVYTNAQVA